MKIIECYKREKKPVYSLEVFPSLKRCSFKEIYQAIEALKKFENLIQEINEARQEKKKLGLKEKDFAFYYALGDFITEVKIKNTTMHFYKIKVGISSPKLSPNSGARLIHGVIREQRKFIPILVYGAYEEGRYYPINNKKFPLKKSGLVGIIDEKLKSI